MTPTQAFLTLVFWAVILGPVVWACGGDAWRDR